MCRKEILHAIGENVIYYSHYGSTEVHQKIKNRTACTNNLSPGYIPKGNEVSVSNRQLYFHVLLQHNK